MSDLTDDECITFAILCGAEFHYDHYGRPERAGNRMYHACRGRWFGGESVTYGYSQSSAARKWLLATGAYWEFS